MDIKRTQEDQSVDWTPFVWAIAIIVVLSFVFLWIYPRYFKFAPVTAPEPTPVETNFSLPGEINVNLPEGTDSPEFTD